MWRGAWQEAGSYSGLWRAVRSGAVFERFTEPARQVVVLAQDEARGLKHSYIGTEHILLGLLREEEGLAARVLGSLGIVLEEVRAKVALIAWEGDEVMTGQIPFTPRGKKVLEHALREALSLGHNYIGTEHMLLGLVREYEGFGARILFDFDVDAEKIRNQVIRMLVGLDGRPGIADPVARLAATLEQIAGKLAERQQFAVAATLGDQKQRLISLAQEIESTLAFADVQEATLSLPYDSAATGRQYDVKPLEGASDSWADQLAAWRKEGWELLTVVHEGERNIAIAARRGGQS